MIRITHVITRTNIGGPAVIVASLLADESNPDIQQRLVRGSTSRDEGDYLSDSVLVENIETIDGLGRRIRPWDDIRTLITLVNHFRRTRPDVVHTHMAKAGALGRLAAFLARVPVRVHTFHGHLLTGYFNPTVTKLVVLAERLLQLFTTHSVVVGNGVRRDLIAAQVVRESRSSVINPGVAIFESRHSSDARRELGLPETGVIVMFMGRFAAIKRPDRFVELARRFVDRSDVHFVMVGDGPLRSTIERDVGGLTNVRLLPWQRDLGLILGATDVVVLCSDNEGVPLLLIEAAIAARPVVSTRVGSVDDVVLDGANGLLVDPQDQEALVNAVRRLVDEEGLRTRLGSAAQIRALEGFTSPIANAAHAALYRSLVTGARDSR